MQAQRAPLEKILGGNLGITLVLTFVEHQMMKSPALCGDTIGVYHNNFMNRKRRKSNNNFSRLCFHALPCTASGRQVHVEWCDFDVKVPSGRLPSPAGSSSQSSDSGYSRIIWMYANQSRTKSAPKPEKRSAHNAIERRYVYLCFVFCLGAFSLVDCGFFENILGFILIYSYRNSINDQITGLYALLPPGLAGQNKVQSFMNFLLTL